METLQRTRSYGRDPARPRTIQLDDRFCDLEVRGIYRLTVTDDGYELVLIDGPFDA